MKYWICATLLLGLLTISAYATRIPDELIAVIPESSEALLEMGEISGPMELHQGLNQIWCIMEKHLKPFFIQQARGCIRILLVLLLCGFADSASKDDKITRLITLAGALTITVLTAGQLDSLLGLGQETIRQLSEFSDVLLPALAAATAAAGGVSSATVYQLASVFFSELLIRLMSTLLIPLVSIYTGSLTAAACIQSKSLNVLAYGIRKAETWFLCTSLLLFTGYLSAVGILSSSMDRTAVKLAKTAMSSVIPVVGKIVSDAAESVLAGSLLLRNSIGTFGMLAILTACVLPFMRLGIQYLLYKVTAFWGSVVGTPELCQLVSGLGSAFGLVLGMAGSCALLLLISILSCVSAVVGI